MKSLKKILAFTLVLVMLAAAVPSAFADEPINNVMLKVYPNVNFATNQAPLVGQNASDIQIKPTSNVTVSSWYVSDTAGNTVSGKLKYQGYILHVSVIAMGGYTIPAGASASVNNESASITVTGSNTADISWPFTPALQAPTVYHNPSNESHKAGEVFSFTATCSDSDATHQWYIYDQVNTRYTVAEMQSAYPQMQFVDSRLDNGTARLNIHNAIEGMDGWTVACCFTNDAGSVWTERAECRITGEITVVDAPVNQVIDPNATPTPTGTDGLPAGVYVVDEPTPEVYVVETPEPSNNPVLVGVTEGVTEEPETAKESAGLKVLKIVGIVLGCIILLAAIVIFIQYLRDKKKRDHRAKMASTKNGFRGKH